MRVAMRPRTQAFHSNGMSADCLSGWRLGIASRCCTLLNVAVAEVSLQGPRIVALKSVTVPIRANMPPCSRCNISFVPFDGTQFGLALRLAQCKL